MSTRAPSVADAYIRATNQHDAGAFAALFADTAIVDDNGREFRGLDAIKAWSEREIFAADVTLDVMDETQRDGKTVITTKVDGNFDRTGLPDPVIITHRITIEGEKIVGLTCRLADQQLAS